MSTSPEFAEGPVHPWERRAPCCGTWAASSVAGGVRRPRRPAAVGPPHRLDRSEILGLTGHEADRPATRGGDWCGEHNVPESQCVECNPDLLPKPKMLRLVPSARGPRMPVVPSRSRADQGPAASRGAAAGPGQVGRTRRPGRENNSKCMLHERRIQFVSQEAVEKAGIEVETVGTAPVVGNRHRQRRDRLRPDPHGPALGPRARQHLSGRQAGGRPR